jgi:uncharacterized protein
MATYHLRRKDKEITDQGEIARLLKQGKYAIIALAKDNVPYIVTLSYGYDAEDGSLYFHCALQGRKLDWLSANARVCATVIEDLGYLENECEHAYRSLVIEGNLTKVDDLAGKKKALTVLLDHLESDPAPILKRNIMDDSSYDKVVILRLKADLIKGKEYRK